MALVDTIMRYLSRVSQDESMSPDLREQATYIGVAYQSHRNMCRLVAQVSVFTRGEFMIHPSHRVNLLGENLDTAVRRHAKEVLNAISDHHTVPSLGDLEGHPIELYSILDARIERAMTGENRILFHQELLINEKKANGDLTRIIRKFGYHYIFRAGLQEYYMTKTVAAMVNFFRPDGRGDEFRISTQQTCYNFLEARLRLSPEEKANLIQRTRCFPEDAHKFWNWLEKHRKAYLAMKAAFAILSTLERR
ncbi:putative mating locus protein [Aspergillus steynii IBT 23096]|uniref:Putative mating locus protein n=1 Tax=Aspergillus steynii IBT 23096 TaxID=1392250 RepID=A0A2I2GFS1_9EURO|nr:putative mating locus protein [Aspergillus steynii IBT 23096]PLB51677.1 putative mating locus protein [Aspergillus steynii IBT 23096]